jgi:hypothetical protein
MSGRGADGGAGAIVAEAQTAMLNRPGMKERAR